MTRLFTFDALITPTIIRFAFFLAVVTTAILALLTFITLSNPSMYFPGNAALALIVAVVILVVGVVGSRILAESILVVFMIRDELAWQRQSRSDVRDRAAE